MPALDDPTEYARIANDRAEPPRSDGQERSAVIRYAVALGAVGAALLLKLLLEPVIKEQTPFLLFFPAVIVASWYGGLGPGLAATAAAALLADYFFLTPIYSFVINTVGQVLRLLFFVLESLFVCFVIVGLHSAKLRAGAHEESRRTAEELWRLQLQEVRDHAIFTLDTEGRVATWNVGAERIFGYTAQEMYGQTITHLFMPEDIAQGADKEELQIAIRDGRSEDVRWHIRKNGTRFFANGSVTALHDAQGNLRGFSKVARDDTPRRIAEEKLEQALRRVEFHVDNSPLAILEWEGDCRIKRWSRAAEKTFGWRSDEVVGKAFTEIGLIHEEDEAHVRTIVERLVGTSAEPSVSLNRNYTKDGRVVYCEWYNSAITDDAGEIISALSMALDVTERHRAEAERAELLNREQTARLQAEEANRVRDEFLATLSHELRTPLTPIIGWVHMMRSGTLSTIDYERGLIIIGKNVRALTRVINDLLDMSAIFGGKMRLEHQSIQLTEVLKEAIEATTPAADARAIRLTYDSCEDKQSDSVIVAGDRTRLVQTFANLLDNAIKFSDTGAHVRIRCETNEHEARVHIEDDGIGINPEFLPHIFERFRQADSSTTRSYGGLGLGLALVRTFAEAHGGTVHVFSGGENCGARFSVHLPRTSVTHNEADMPIDRVAGNERATPSEPSAATATRTLEQREHATPAATVAPALRVLLIEDTPDTLDMLRAVFAHEGFTTTFCRSATEALRHHATGDFDLIVADIGLPEMNGYELLRELRRHPSHACTPAVALTGYVTPKDIEQAHAAGFDAHIAKPVDPRALVEKIKTLKRT